MLNHAAAHLKTVLGSFAPFPKWGDPAWQALPEEGRRHLIDLAEQTASKKIPVLRASGYMEFKRNGNRSRYENVFFARRDYLFALVLGECAEGKGRFIDSIIDYIWAICEESSWTVPATNTRVTSNLPLDALVDFDEDPFVCLFSAETASLLAWTHYFLADRLNEESEMVARRIEKEINFRILTPYLKHDSMWWMGLVGDRPVNNWNPWVNSNVLVSFLLTEKDPDRRLAGAMKIARSAQRFLDIYHPDGGCDEGPNYFSVAGASLLDLLEIFCDATNGQFNVYGDPLIRNMADYIRHVHIADGYCVNFADAPCRITNFPAALLLRTGLRTDNPALADFARSLCRNGLALKPWQIETDHCWKLYRALKALFTFTEADSPASAPTENSHYFPGIQVVTARTKDDLFFAAKGGHNSESHNHNDIGNYIVYAQGKPCAIDAGVGVYSKKTFSDQRYTIWAMQSGFHNTAVINGCDQPAGAHYAAHSASFKEDSTQTRFSLNIEKAYPSEAKLNAFHRSFVLDSGANTLAVTDKVCMDECTEPVRLPVMCYLPPVIGEGTAVLNGVTLHFDPAQFTASFEEIDLNDPENPITCWEKDTLYRLMLTRTEKKADDSWTITYTLN